MRLLKFKIWLFQFFLPKFVQQWYIKRIEKQINNYILDNYVKFFNRRIIRYTNEKLIKEDAGYILGPYLLLTNTPTICNCENPKNIVQTRYAISDTGVKLNSGNVFTFQTA